MHQKLRRLLMQTGSRQRAISTLKEFSKRHKKPAAATNQQDLARHFQLPPTPRHTLQNRVERALERAHRVKVSVLVNERGVTLSPRDAQRPAHRLVFPFSINNLIRTARQIAESRSTTRR